MVTDVKVSVHHFIQLTTNNDYFLDVDECADDNLNICVQECNNTHGSYICLCHDGYELKSDGFSCTG